MGKKIHPLNLFLMSLIFIIAIFFKMNLLKLSLLFAVLLPYVFPSEMPAKELLKKVSYILFAICSLVVLKLLYAHEDLTAILQYSFRLFFLFFVSMLSFAVIDFDKIFVYLMSTKKMKVNWGYPMLLAMNSLQLLKTEQERIAYNARLRNLKWHQRYLVFFPLLVFAIRHSERGAMALVTRGLNPDKVFYHVDIPTKRDRIILISYFLLTLTFFLVA